MRISYAKEKHLSFVNTARVSTTGKKVKLLREQLWQLDAVVVEQQKLNPSEKGAIAAIMGMPFMGEESPDFIEKGASEMLGAERLRKV